jgi:ArgP family transcriptional regulator
MRRGRWVTTPHRCGMPLAVNADSLSTWFLPPLTRLAERHPVVFDLHRDDQDFTAALLESGTVTGAVTSRAHPVAGCRVVPLGELVYEAVATPAFRDRWLDTAASDAAAGLRDAPLIDFDRRDDLQTRWLRARGVDPAEPPRHRVPASHDFAAAVQLGLMGAAATAAVAAGAGCRHARPSGGCAVRVPLYWQQWNLRSELLDAVAEEIEEGRRCSPGGSIRSAVADREHDLPRVWPRSISRCAASASPRSKTRSTKTRIAPESSRRARVASTLPSGTTCTTWPAPAASAASA